MAPMHFTHWKLYFISQFMTGIFGLDVIYIHDHITVSCVFLHCTMTDYESVDSRLTVYYTKMI